MSDFESSIGKAFQKEFGNVALEKCSVHFQRNLDKKLKSKKIRLFEKLNRKNTVMSFFLKNLRQLPHIGVSPEVLNDYLDESYEFAKCHSNISSRRLKLFISYVKETYIHKYPPSEWSVLRSYTVNILSLQESAILA